MSLPRESTLPLLLLPEELILKLLSFLDLATALSLGATCHRLRRLLANPFGRVTWRGLIQRALGPCGGWSAITPNTARRASRFLVNMEEGDLLIELLESVVCRLRGASCCFVGNCDVVVSTPHFWVRRLHTLYDFTILAHMESAASGPIRCPVLRIVPPDSAMLPPRLWPRILCGPSLRLLSAHACQQHSIVAEFLGSQVAVNTRAEALQLARLLSRCRYWSIHSLYLNGDVGPDAWAGLAAAAPRGQITRLFVQCPIGLANSHSEHVRSVHAISQHWYARYPRSMFRSGATWDLTNI
jgi:hypothetical protein